MKITKAILLIVFFFTAQKIFAARVFVSDDIKTFSSSKDFYIDVLLDTEGQAINAFEGEVLYDDKIISFVKTSDNESITSLWVDPVIASGSSVNFSGIIFNGFEGVIDPVSNIKKPGVLTRIYFKPLKEEGGGIISLTDLVVYKNDGLGTAIRLKDENFAFIISPNGQEQIDESLDTIMPEDFTPIITNYEDLYNGQYVLVFKTTDKQSGIDHYEVKEGDNPWVVSNSPYLLMDQSLRSQIKVKAVDRNNNERIVTVKKPQKFTYKFILFSLIILALLFFVTNHKKTIGRSHR